MQTDDEIIQWLQGNMPVPTLRTAEELLVWLTQYCNGLLQADFPGLIQLLYRVDVSEAKLRYLLRNVKGEDAGKIMALLLLERVEEIVASRKRYRMPDRDIPDEEKW
jgi:hypothetical protein